MKFSFRRFELQLARTWRIASGVGGSGTNTYSVLFVEVSDDKGRSGIGEAASTGRYQQPAEVIEAFLKKVDGSKLSFDDIPGSMKYLDTLAAGNDAAKCGVNIALLDGAAKAAGKPIYDYLGLGFKEDQHITSFSIGIDTPDVIRQKVHEAEIYPVLKLKVGSPDDQKNFAALREAAPT